MVDNQIDYDKIRERVERRMALRAKFIRELSSFVGVNIMLWAIWGFSEGNSIFSGHIGLPWPLFVTVFWGISVGRHGLRAYFSDQIDSAFDREMEKEIEREKARVANSMYPGDADMLEKTKRKNGAVRLSDDGELIYEDQATRNSAGQDL